MARGQQHGLGGSSMTWGQQQHGLGVAAWPWGSIMALGQQQHGLGAAAWPGGSSMALGQQHGLGGRGGCPPLAPGQWVNKLAMPDCYFRFP